MNIDGLLVLQRSDLVHLAKTAARYEGVPLLFIEPALVDEAAALGLQNYHFRRLAVNPDFQALATAEAMAMATQVDLQLTRERQRLWPDCAMQGWDVGLFYLALLRTTVMQGLAPLIEASFPEARIGMLRPSVPQQMYFDSFVCHDLLARDPSRFFVMDSYDQVRWGRAEMYSQTLDGTALRVLMADGRVSALTHTPTCFYDHAWLADEVSRSHSFTVDLPAPVWDVPLHRSRSLLQPRAAPTADAGRYGSVARSVLARCLGHLLLHPWSRDMQLDAWADRCVWQAQNYLLLREALQGKQPHFLLSDQDTGLNGPLFSVAAERGAAVTVVPHSGHPSMVVPHARRVQVVERAGYGTQARTVGGQVAPVRAVRYPVRVEPQPHSRLNRICLLLNSMQTEGLSYVDVFALAAFYKPLAALCAAADVDLILRAKPSGPALSVLCSALGVSASHLVEQANQPLEALARQTPLCVSYGEPTTGVAPFLDGGSLVLQVNEQHWPGDYLACMPLVKDRVIPLLDHAAALALLRQLLAEPSLFTSQRQAQSGVFALRRSQAHPHLF